MKSFMKRVALALASIGIALGMTVALAPGASAAPRWPAPGGCLNPLRCGSVSNFTITYKVKLVKNWKFSQYDYVTLDSFNASDLTDLSVGKSFGAWQGYDVQGFCLNPGQNNVELMNTDAGPWTINGGSRGYCWRVGRESVAQLRQYV